MKIENEEEKKGCWKVKYTNKFFRKNIDYLVSKKNMTNSELETNLGMGVGYLSKYKVEVGAPEPKVTALLSLSNVFEVSIDDLLNIDLEEKERKDLEIGQSKEMQICKKLIEDTKQNMCEWHKLNHYEDGFIESNSSYSNWLLDENTFRSHFTYNSYDINDVLAFTSFIDNNNAQVVIMRCPNVENEKKSYIYELYVINNRGKVFKCCSSHKDISDFDYFDLFEEEKEIVKEEMFEVILNELFNSIVNYISFGKDNYEKELIYDSYLGLLEF